MRKRQYAIKVMRHTRSRKPDKPLTNEQLGALLNAADEEWKAMVLTGLHTGERIRDVARLTWDAVDLKRATIRFRRAKASPRVVPIGPELLSHLNSLARPSDPKSAVFATCFKDATQNPWKLSVRFAKMQRDRDLEPVGFHCLRITSSCRLQNRPVPPAVARMTCGHYSPANLAALKQELSRLARLP